MSGSEPRKTIVVNPDFLKFPMRGGRTKKNREDPPKPIKIRTEKKPDVDKTYKRRALNYIRKHQEEKYKRMMKMGEDPAAATLQSNGVVEINDNKTYADNFNNDFDDSLAFLQKLSEQNSQKIQSHNSTLKQPPHIPNSTLFQSQVLDQILDQSPPQNGISGVFGGGDTANIDERPLPPVSLPKPAYGCLKGGTLPTFRTLKSRSSEYEHLAQSQSQQSQQYKMSSSSPTNHLQSSISKMTPEQQRAELKQFLEQRKEEKQRIDRVKRQRGILKPGKKQKRTTTRTFRVGKSKHYPRVGVLIPNKTIRTQILAKKQKIRETPLEDVRKYLIKKGLIRVGSSCPNDVLRQMYESSMMMCGEIQNHNPDNLLYNYLHNGL